MRPGAAAICEGSVVHRREATAAHEFTSPVSQVWIDPDRPDDLCDLHPLYSSRWPSPARFRRRDYGTSPSGSLSDAARAEVGAAIGRSVNGPVRMLSQIRRWGWLFNPITVFLVWDTIDPTAPVRDVRPLGAVLEVTNTPWKERRRYALPLASDGRFLRAPFDKTLHVSPFLGMDHRYDLRIADRDDRVAIDIDVFDRRGDLALHTSLRTGRATASRGALTAALRSSPLPTHRVSAGIHAQAARLWRKGVPFVPHPKRSRHEVSA